MTRQFPIARKRSFAKNNHVAKYETLCATTTYIAKIMDSRELPAQGGFVITATNWIKQSRANAAGVSRNLD